MRVSVICFAALLFEFPFCIDLRFSLIVLFVIFLSQPMFVVNASLLLFVPLSSYFYASFASSHVFPLLFFEFRQFPLVQRLAFVVNAFAILHTIVYLLRNPTFGMTDLDVVQSFQ